MPTLCLTRSEPGNSVLAESLRASGWQIVQQPAITVVHSTEWRAYLPQLRRPSLVILTSGHAARAYLETELPSRGDTGTVLHLAQGPATAEVLCAQGYDVEIPERPDAHGLLAHPCINALAKGSPVWVISGEGGREVLQPALAELGLDALKLAVYKRVSLELPRSANFDLIEISSEAALKTVAHHTQPQAQNVLVVSGRLAELAREVGFKSVQQAAGADGDSILACLRALHE